MKPTTTDVTDIEETILHHLPTEAKRTGPPASGEYAAPCPQCGGDDRFILSLRKGESGQFWCRQCDWGGDGIDLLRSEACAGLSFKEACRELGLEHKLDSGSSGQGSNDTSQWLREAVMGAQGHEEGEPSGDAPSPGPEKANAPPKSSSPEQPSLLRPPGGLWQEHARRLVVQCQDALWNDNEAAQRARWYLRGRGFTKHTMREAKLGFNRRERRPHREDWGLDPDKEKEGGGRLWIPRGIVIPWEIGSRLWKLNIRRGPKDVKREGDPKYIQVAGKRPCRDEAPAWSTNALYGADDLRNDRPAIIVEGELDALALRQEIGKLAIAVATGSTHGARRARWVAALAQCRRVLLAFDAEEPGEKAAQHWASVLPDTDRLRPEGGDDPADMLENERDLTAWVREGLGYQEAPSTENETASKTYTKDDFDHPGEFFQTCQGKILPWPKR